MAKLDAQSKRRGAAGPVPEAPDEAGAGGADLRATVTLSPEALSALLDEVKRSRGQESEVDAADEFAEEPEPTDDDPDHQASGADRRPPLRARRTDR
jgi:hypothetical protein